MNKKNVGTLFIIVGIIIGAVSLLADVLGLGGNLAVFGWKQILGAGVGVLLIIIGVWFVIRKEKQEG